MGKRVGRLYPAFPHVFVYSVYSVRDRRKAAACCGSTTLYNTAPMIATINTLPIIAYSQLVRVLAFWVWELWSMPVTT